MGMRMGELREKGNTGGLSEGVRGVLTEVSGREREVMALSFESALGSTRIPRLGWACQAGGSLLRQVKRPVSRRAEVAKASCPSESKKERKGTEKMFYARTRREGGNPP